LEFSLADEIKVETNKDGVKTLVLTPRTRVPVETSRGKFYARHISVGDISSVQTFIGQAKEKAFQDLQKLGERFLKQLVCVHEKDDKTPALTDEVYACLTPDDFKALTEAVGQACQVTLPASSNPVETLGSVLYDQVVEQFRRLEESAAQIKKTVDASFGSMSSQIKTALGESMSGIAAIRESLKNSSAVEALRKLQEEQMLLHKRLTPELTGAASAIAAFEKNQKRDLEYMLEDIKPYQPINPSAADLAQKLPPEDGSQDIASKALLDDMSERPPWPRPDITENLRSLLHFPPVEETPIGRAAIAGEKSALQLQEVAGLIGQMTEQLATMHQLFLVEVIPQWIINIKDSGEVANTSIGLAKKAIYWSIAVTVIATLAQLGVTQYYRCVDEDQAKATAAMVKQQLAATLELNKQIAVDSRRLQVELAKLSQAVSSVPPASGAAPGKIPTK
jgi:hypothetical protein